MNFSRIALILLACSIIGCNQNDQQTKQSLPPSNLRINYPIEESKNNESLIKYFNEFINYKSNNLSTLDFYHLIELIEVQPKLTKDQIFIVARLILNTDGEHLEMAREVLFLKLIRNPGVFCDTLNVSNYNRYFKDHDISSSEMEYIYDNLLTIPIECSGDTEEGEKKIKEEIVKKIRSKEKANTSFGKYILKKYAL